MNSQPRISYSTPYTLWPLSWLLLVVGTGLYPDPYKYQKINPRMLNTSHWLQPHSGCSLLKLPQNGFWGVTPSNLHGSGPNSAGTHPTRKYASRETLGRKKSQLFSVSNTTHRFSNFPEANWPQSWPQHVNRCPHESYQSRFSIFFPGGTKSSQNHQIWDFGNLAVTCLQATGCAVKPILPYDVVANGS